ncbi:MAG: hypothetical protein OEY86_20975, partial [Nitrospira sp.]|nr:hypothetical protein [Nitrospira sp.]
MGILTEVYRGFSGSVAPWNLDGAVIRLNHPIAVGREQPIWVEDCHRPGADVHPRDCSAPK